MDKYAFIERRVLNSQLAAQMFRYQALVNYYLRAKCNITERKNEADIGLVLFMIDFGSAVDSYFAHSRITGIV